MHSKVAVKGSSVSGVILCPREVHVVTHVCVQGNRMVKLGAKPARATGGLTEGMTAREAHNARRREKRRLANLAKCARLCTLNPKP